MGIRIQLGNRRNGSKASGPASLVGKLVTTAFLSIFVVAGGFFGTMMLKETQRGIDQQGWVQRPCNVIDSGVSIDPSSNKPYTPWVEYTYTHGGRSYTSANVSEDDAATYAYREAQAIALDYPPGGTGKIYVNPDSPKQAVLKTSGGKSLMMIGFFAIWLPLFSGVPLVIIIATWWPKKNEHDEKAKAARERGKGKVGGVIIGVLFGGVFTAAGLGMLIFMTILPLWRTAISQTWTATPCTVERSEVLSYSDSDGTTYRIDVLFFYEVNNQRYGSNRHSFSMIGSSSGHSGKQAAASQYPVGSTATCYVNPNDPTSAVLFRGLSWANLWGLFPLPFLAVGLFVMYFSFFGDSSKGGTWRPKRGQRNKQDVIPSPSDGSSRDNIGPVVLRPGRARLGKFVGITFAALFWNGIVSVFLYQVIGGFMNGDVDACLTIFMIPFVIIGLVLIGAAFRGLLVLFAPGVIIELGRRAIPIGGSTELRWRISRGKGTMTGLSIKLIGQESATYTRGTDTVTDTHSFFEMELSETTAQTDDPLVQSLGMNEQQGQFILQLPDQTMHSFEARNNKIVWKLQVQAKVKHWPDPKDSYTITVLPLPIGQAY